MYFIPVKHDITTGRIVKTYQRMSKLEVNLTFHKEKHHDRIELFNVRNKKVFKDVL